MKYRLDIDGLRALAVLSVVFYHANLGFPGGYVGVDVFFVISGYLITGLLLKEFETKNFSYRNFWERRVRRLVPALALMTLITTLASGVILIPEDFRDLGGALIAQPLLASNIYFWRVVQHGYFGDPPESRPLLHTWSLGVEEQFYVIFPLLLMLLWRRFRTRKAIGLFLGGIGFVSLGLSVFLTPIKGVFAFFTLPTRAWELLLGALLHFLPSASSNSLAVRQAWATTGLGLITFSVFFYTHETLFPGATALAPCMGTAMLIWGAEGSRIGRWLSLPWMVFVGQISYSLYLWHWPIMAWTAYFGKLQSTEVKVLTVLASFWLGYLSWRWVETPIRQRQFLASRRALGWLLLSYICGSIFLGLAILNCKGSLQTDPFNLKSPSNKYHRRFVHDELKSNATPEKLPWLGDVNQRRTSFLLWGDSHAMSLAAVFDTLGKEYHLKGIQLTAASTPPLSTISKAGYRKRSLDSLKEWQEKAAHALKNKELRAVFLAGFWSSYSHPGLADDLRATADWIRLKAQNPNLRIVLIQDVPTFEFIPWRAEQLTRRWPSLQLFSMVDEVSHRKKNYEFDQAVHKGWRDEILDPSVAVLKWQSVYRYEDGQPLYFDKHHLTDYGALQLRSIFDPVFYSLVSDPE